MHALMSCPCAQLFVDMSVLVETQGEMLDQIEYSVQQVCAWG